MAYAKLFLIIEAVLALLISDMGNSDTSLSPLHEMAELFLDDPLGCCLSRLKLVAVWLLDSFEANFHVYFFSRTDRWHSRGFGSLANNANLVEGNTQQNYTASNILSKSRCFSQN